MPDSPSSFEMCKLDVVVADDCDMFIDLSAAALIRAGCLEENIHRAEDGVQALERLDHLQDGGHDDAPILFVLDVRMPNMGGNQAAAEVKKRYEESTLRRCPFVVSLSAGHTRAPKDDGSTDYNLIIPKPLQGDALTRTLQDLRRWWDEGNGRPAGTAPGGSRPCTGSRAFDVSRVEVVLADDEAVERMVLQMLFAKAGVATEIREADDEAALLEELQDLQAGDASNPIVCVIGVAAWVDRVLAEQFSRRPFLVCASVAAAGACKATRQKFDAVMHEETANSDDVARCLQDCEVWWSR